ncbi:hypothetical protein sos41_02600 [Alphaproteobacteria bacterium SO-S41]|nr:hypothetical protein sos41_02600 [Alphaproteobacteria bacterium SO-S41]
MAKSPKGPKKVEALNHPSAARRNIPTAELQSIAEQVEEMRPVPPVRYPRTTPLAAGATRERDGDLDPQIVWNGARIRLSPDQIRQLTETGTVEIGEAQLVWRGKDRQDWSDLIVQAPPLYIQEKVHPKAIIDDLVRRTAEATKARDDAPDLFADFNGLADPEARTEFYAHDQHWSNRMILGDSLQVMASLAEREHLRGQVQCIYFDPPYGIKFNSNWQVSTQSRDVKDGKQTDVSREPEQVKAFRDTWKDGIHSYLTYLRDRLTVMRDLLTESGSVFVQIGDENVHRVRALMDEVFGDDNCISEITIQKTGGQPTGLISNNTDYLLWYARDKARAKYRQLYHLKIAGEGEGSGARYDQTNEDGRLYQTTSLTSSKPPGSFPVNFHGKPYLPGQRFWTTGETGFERLARADRMQSGLKTIRFKRFLDDFPAYQIVNLWADVAGAGDKLYVVQTSAKVLQRCILMATDPGDLVLDPTCGSGTTAFVAEQWGRRWITIDTSRVALALARTRLMSARYPFYHLADTPEGRRKEAELTGKVPSEAPTYRDLRQGFVYERAPHVTLKSIANNAEIDVIWESYQTKLEPLRASLNLALNKTWEEWEIPRESGAPWDQGSRQAHAIAKDSARPESERLLALAIIKENTGRVYTLENLPEKPRTPWGPEAERLHAAWWEQRIARQEEIDASIARAAEVELLYDRPYTDTGRVRVAGPFTVESLSPHRIVPADAEELLDELDAASGQRRRTAPGTPTTDFATMVIEHLRTAGVHQARKDERIAFTSLMPWPGEYIGAEGRFMEGEIERRAAIFIGPEFGTLGRNDLAAAAREASEGRFDALIACAFNFDAHASDMKQLGPLPILKAKMNPDLHMAQDLKNTGKGNLFVVFGEPDIDIHQTGDGMLQVQIKGVDIFDPNTGAIRSGDTDSIAAWFIDTEYNHESFFVRHAYFLGANDPYKSLKTALKAEIDEDAWSTLYRDTSRPFSRPKTGKIAVKVINHFGDEVMKVFGV